MKWKILYSQPHCQESERVRNTQLTERIVELEQEMTDYSGFTEYINILKVENKKMVETVKENQEEIVDLNSQIER